MSGLLVAAGSVNRFMVELDCGLTAFCLGYFNSSAFGLDDCQINKLSDNHFFRQTDTWKILFADLKHVNDTLSCWQNQNSHHSTNVALYSSTIFHLEIKEEPYSTTDKSIPSLSLRPVTSSSLNNVLNMTAHKWERSLEKVILKNINHVAGAVKKGG